MKNGLNSRAHNASGVNQSSLNLLRGFATRTPGLLKRVWIPDLTLVLLFALFVLVFVSANNAQARVVAPLLTSGNNYTKLGEHLTLEACIEQGQTYFASFDSSKMRMYGPDDLMYDPNYTRHSGRLGGWTHMRDG